MRVLFLNLYFPPDTSATAKVAESMVHALAGRHDVTVVCGRPSYDPTERRAWKIWGTERCGTASGHSVATEPGIIAQPRLFTVIRVGSTDYPRMRMQLRVLNYLTYTMLATLRAAFIPCDVIFVMTDPPFAGIVAAFLAMLKGRPLIYDIQDMYPDMAVAGSIVKPGLLSRLWERLHRWALRRASRVIVLGDDMRARIAAKQIDPDKVHIVRNCVAPHYAGSQSTAVNLDVVQAIRGDFRFVLLHAGNLGFYGAWDTIIAAARQLQNANIGFVFVGDGAERLRLGSLAEGVTNVRFLPFFPSTDIPSVLAAPDLHIVTVKPGLEGVVVPSKMFGILAAGKPILAVAATQTDVATLGAKYGFGVSVDPDDPRGLASAIRRLAANRLQLGVMAKAARSAASQYSRASELTKMVSIVSDLITKIS
jgi:colanic acid biosynthesis glycosyl transferase WcaI